MTSWISISRDSDFSLQNLPYGIFSTEGTDPRIGVAVGEYVLDLKILAQNKVFGDLDVTTLASSTLNAYAALSKDIHHEVRRTLQQILASKTKFGHVLRDNHDLKDKSLIPLSKVQMHLPMHIGDYTDFFVGLYHAQNTSNIVRPGSAIKDVSPSFFDLPVAYHGRASSVVISGTSFQRPKGQIGPSASGFCQKLDFEVEFAAFIGRGNEMGNAIDVDQAEDHIFGFVLMNDWSARDIQFWESAPLGPFNGKNFCTTISPWIVPLEALEPFRTIPQQPRELHSYLMQKRTNSAYNIPIRVTLQADERYHVAECNTNNVVFSFAQMIAHHTRGGCPMRPGDLIATGTLSGPTKEELGCLLELSHHGTNPYELVAESSSKRLRRGYLEDGDLIEFSAQAKGSETIGNVGFGVCQGKVLPLSGL